MSKLTRDGTAEPVSRDQILRHERGQGNIHFSCSADHVQDWQPYRVDPYSCHMCDHTYIHGKQRRSSSTTSWYLSHGNIFYIVVLWRSESDLRFLYSYSSRNSISCSPLLSLTSPPRPRFCAEDLPKPCWSTLRRGQPSTCY